jgi:hypothetical protein
MNSVASSSAVKRMAEWLLVLRVAVAAGLRLACIGLSRIGCGAEVGVRTPGLIATLDQARADADEAAQDAAIARAKQLLAPPDPDTAFGARYLRALQDHPEVVLAHRDVTAALG